ncbi:hypothetical protein BpHYR1_039450 [Brachionus plicatilis]|uniref:Uncharacterized protein n=1 Tax=Brachionus plicatilis TaxID=10195 RepID=A0A3M7Q3K4_BRAPC|nr:hypothetical protein BpHYR1_039450 [Brachionus plicatilis]
MLHLLLHDFYFNLVPFFAVLHFAVFISQLGFFFFQLALGDLPKGVDFVSFQLKIVAFLSLSVQFFANAHYVLFQLFFAHLLGRYSFDDRRIRGLTIFGKVSGRQMNSQKFCVDYFRLGSLNKKIFFPKGLKKFNPLKSWKNKIFYTLVNELEILIK